MFVIKLGFVHFLLTFHGTNCERRIVDGAATTENKRYMVYLVKAPVSPRDYDSWLCGGAIVNKEFVLTSAACVADVKFIYVIAGSPLYTADEFIEIDECAKHMKKKVIFTCSPVSYELVYNKVERWADIDIAVVQVESPYNFRDRNFEKMCTYIPNAISVNYFAQYETPGTKAVVYGWGHSKAWREPFDYNNYNQNQLHYAAVTISDNEECKKDYANYPNMSQIIDQYMICSTKGADIDDKGVPLAKNIKREGKNIGECITAEQKLLGLEGESCEDDDEQNNTGIFATIVDSQNTEELSVTVFRRHLCQNDHGGPLVTWMGGKEVVIGVASVFRVSGDSKCVGPDLYTSTAKNKAFLNCVLNGVLPTPAEKLNRLINCDSLPVVRGFDMVKKYISWRSHPDGPADNERDVV